MSVWERRVYVPKSDTRGRPNVTGSRQCRRANWFWNWSVHICQQSHNKV